VHKICTPNSAGWSSGPFFFFWFCFWFPQTWLWISQFLSYTGNVIVSFQDFFLCTVVSFLFFVHKMCKLALREQNLAVPDLFPESWSSQRFHVLNSMNFCHEWVGRGEREGGCELNKLPRVLLYSELVGYVHFHTTWLQTWVQSSVHVIIYIYNDLCLLQSLCCIPFWYPNHEV